MDQIFSSRHNGKYPRGWRASTTFTGKARVRWLLQYFRHRRCALYSRKSKYTTQKSYPQGKGRFFMPSLLDSIMILVSLMLISPSTLCFARSLLYVCLCHPTVSKSASTCTTRIYLEIIYLEIILVKTFDNFFQNMLSGILRMTMR